MLNLIEIVKAIILGIIQGITEWLPISSTGHLLLFENWIPFTLSESFVDTFMVIIQVGSILAVILLFFDKLNPLSPKKTAQSQKETWILWSKILVATIPAGIIGILFDDIIDQYFDELRMGRRIGDSEDLIMKQSVDPQKLFAGCAMIHLFHILFQFASVGGVEGGTEGGVALQYGADFKRFDDLLERNIVDDVEHFFILLKHSISPHK